MSEISIVILTFNSISFIEPCLSSLFKQDYQNFETIVVDSGSRDGIVGFIKKNYPQVVLIENKQNLGAARARNQGIGVARGKWVLTLDCDIILEKDFLKRIMSFAEKSDEYVGMFQSKILNIDKRTIYSCGIYLSKLRRFYDIGKGKIDNGQFNNSQYVFGACCAASLYRRKMLEEIKEDTGYFDERFFFLAEDVDLSWRAQKKEWKTIFYPGAVCYHYGDSSKTPKDFRQYLCWRNRKLMLGKHRLNKFNSLLIALVYDFPRSAFLFLNNCYVRNGIHGQ